MEITIYHYAGPLVILLLAILWMLFLKQQHPEISTLTKKYGVQDKIPVITLINEKRIKDGLKPHDEEKFNEIYQKELLKIRENNFINKILKKLKIY